MFEWESNEKDMTSIAKQNIQNAGVLRLPNQPGGYVGIDSSGEVVGTFAQRVDTEANLAAIVLKNGELAYASDTESLFIGDGATAGGLFLHQSWQTSGRLVTSGGVMTLSSANAAVNSYSATLKANSEYEFKVAASFTGDTSNTSNFRMFIHTEPFFTAVDTAYPSFAVMDWFTNTGDENMVQALESQHQGIVHPLNEVIMMETTLQTDLTRSQAQVSGSLRVKTIGAFDMKFRPYARVSSPSAASCDLMVLHRRIG